MIEIVAVFVACQASLLICYDLPYLREKHTFSNTDDCRAAVREIIKQETLIRKSNDSLFPVIMGKCRWYLNEKKNVSAF